MAGWSLACGLADKAIDVAYLAVAAFLLARPLDAWLQTHPASGRQLVAAAGGAVPGGHGDPPRRVVPAVVLFRPRVGASVQAEHPDVSAAGFGSI